MSKQEEVYQPSGFFKELKSYIANSYAREIKDEIELEKKYGLVHTEEEMDKRKKMQERFKFLQAQKKKVIFNAMRKTYNWLRRYYFNTTVKTTIENYEYAKEMKRTYGKIILYGMTKGLTHTFIFFIFMRLIKYKGQKDYQYLLFVNFLLSVTWIDSYMYSFLIFSKLPLSKTDLERRKELIEEFVYGGYQKTPILIEEIKKISKYYLPEKIDYTFVTAMGQKVNLTSYSGRLYITCDNYYEVFGYNKQNAKLKINNLDIMNVRDREIIYGLFKFYDYLTDKYIDKQGIKPKVKNMNTLVLEDIVKNKGITKEELERIKKTRILKDVEFNKIEIENEDNKKEIKEVTKKSEEEKKFYI